MDITKVIKPAFAVIGKEGSSKDGDGFYKKLWEEANAHFGEVEALAKRDEDGCFSGFWGAMSDFSRSFQPWEQGFTQGLYLAGVEADMDADAPQGWTKWVLPASEYLVVKQEGLGTFADMIQYMKDHDFTLAGAVYDYNCPRENGQGYMYFPIRRL